MREEKKIRKVCLVFYVFQKGEGGNFPVTDRAVKFSVSL